MELRSKTQNLQNVRYLKKLSIMCSCIFILLTHHHKRDTQKVPKLLISKKTQHFEIPYTHKKNLALAALKNKCIRHFLRGKIILTISHFLFLLVLRPSGRMDSREQLCMDQGQLRRMFGEDTGMT